MEKYKKLINKKINLENNGTIINSYKITEIIPTGRFMVGLEGSGNVYNCPVVWENKELGKDYPTMEFSENVFEELLKDGVSYMPFSNNQVCFRIKKEYVN